MRSPPCDVLVTGAAGMLGSAVLSVLAARGLTAAGLVRGPAPGIAGASWLKADLGADDELQAALESARPACIVHCAALTDVDWCERHPDEAHRFHAGVTAAIARWADDNGARLVHVSTDSVFDGARGGYDEADTPAPVNVYARTKLAGEAAAARARDHLVARTNFYGWSPPGKTRLCEWALQRLRQGEPLPGFTDVRFSPLCVPDLAATLATLARSDLRGIVHLAAADGISKYEFLQQLAQRFGYPADAVRPARAADAAFAAPRPLDTTLRTRRAGELGHDAPTVAQGLRRFVSAARARPQGSHKDTP